jgi:hypothetical protein
MNVSSAFGAAAIGLVVASGANFTAEAINPAAKGLAVKEVWFKDGKFYQRIASASGQPMSGEWDAEIYRVSSDGASMQLCAGSGIGVYSGELKSYTPDGWTLDYCPPILPGDIAEASWSFRNEEGIYQSVGVQFEIMKK